MATIPLSNILTSDFTALRSQGVGLTDYAGRPISNTVFGDTVSAGRSDSVSVQFNYNISSYDTNATITGTGTNTLTDGKAVASTGTGTGNARVESVRSIVNYPGHESHAVFDAVFSQPDSNCAQKIGCFNGEGFWIGYQGNIFGVAVRNNGVDTFIPQSSWNGNQLTSGSFVLDPSKMNLYRITYGWGILPTTFEVSAGSNQWIVLHTIETRNITVGPVITNPYLPMAVEVNSTVGPVSPVTVGTSTWSGGSSVSDPEGSASERYHTIRATPKAVTSGVLTNILTVRNPATWQGKTNYIHTRLIHMSLSVEGSQPVDLYWQRNATVGGSPSFTEVSSNETPLQYDVAGTTVSGGTLSWGTTMAKSSHLNQDTCHLQLSLPPGNETTLVASSSSNTIVSCFIRVKDLF